MTPKQLLPVVESALLGQLLPSSSQRVELMHALRSSFSSLQSLHSYLPPKPSDRAQVQSKEVRLSNGPPILLDDQDVEIKFELKCRPFLLQLMGNLPEEELERSHLATKLNSYAAEL